MIFSHYHIYMIGLQITCMGPMVGLTQYSVGEGAGIDELFVLLHGGGRYAVKVEAIPCLLFEYCHVIT